MMSLRASRLVCHPEEWKSLQHVLGAEQSQDGRRECRIQIGVQYILARWASRGLSRLGAELGVGIGISSALSSTPVHLS